MKELRAILDAHAHAQEQGQATLLATVVQTGGSTYRKAGARMLLDPTGWLAGSVSGGCLEGDILKKAWWRTGAHGPVVVTYDSTGDEDLEDDIAWGFGLGCNGVVHVLLERLTGGPNDPMPVLDCGLSQRRPVVLATVFRATDTPPVRVGDRLTLGPGGEVAGVLATSPLRDALHADARQARAAGRSRTARYALAGGEVEVFLEVVLPPTPLVICGSGHDALPLARLAKELGWHVTIADGRPAEWLRARFPMADAVVSCPPEAVTENVLFDARTAAVVMTHNYDHDRRLLGALLPSPVGYLGVLGPRRRTERMLGGTGAGEQPSHLHSPVGLDIGADTPEQIALSIVAEVQAALSGRGGGPLRARSGPIYGRDEVSTKGDGTPPARGERPACALSAL